MPKWSAAIPPVKFLYSTSANPTSSINAARRFWSGKRETESGRYSYAPREPLITPPIFGRTRAK